MVVCAEVVPENTRVAEPQVNVPVPDRSRGKPCTTLSFRSATESDIPAILAAENDLHDSPWTAGNFKDSLTASHRLLVAEENACLVGYAVTSQVLDEAELLTIGIVESAQRRGCGSALLGHLIGQLRATGVRRLFLEVRSSNAPAHNLYQRFGFAEIGRRRGYYQTAHGREDAAVMALQLSVEE